MQVLNEELQSFNVELEVKMKNMLVVIGDMQNLINSMEIVMIFFDMGLQICCFIFFVIWFFKLLLFDVGWLLFNIVIEFDYL